MGQFFTNIWNSIVEYFTNLGSNADQILIGIVKIVLIIIVAKLASVFVRRLIVRSLKRRKEKKPKSQLAIKSETIESVAKSTSKVVIYVIAMMTILSVLGLGGTVSSLLATAGIGGIAIAFGAQSLVKDLVAGIFMFFEDQFSVGEYIEADGEKGTVEAITIRTTRIRKFSGETAILPNGSFEKVINYSRGNLLAIINMSISYESDATKAGEVMKAVGLEYMKTHDNVIEEPQVLGVAVMGESDMVIRMIMRVKPLTHWTTERDMMLLIKQEFDKSGIEIPYPHRVVING